MKKIIQDIYTTNKKSIRLVKKSDIKPVEEKEVKEYKEDKKEVLLKTLPKRGNSFIEFDSKKVSKYPSLLLWIISIVSVTVLVFLISSTFSTASIKISPKEEKIVLDNTYDIQKTGTVGLNYEIMTIKKELSKELKTDGEENVERKAVGKATIYNNDSASKQRLINNTRLETTDGLIYRIRQSVDVPGYKIIGGIKTPGSVEVEIIADVPGDTYNMKLTDFKGDFTIPGFKGTAKYKTFYARLSADVTGGLIGKVKKVSEQNLKAGREELKNNLKTELIKEIYTQKPDQFFFFKDNYYIQYSDLSDSSENENYKISEEASIYVVVFNKDNLASFIAKDKLKEFDDSKIDIIWSDNIISSISGKTEKPWNEDILKIKLTGGADVVWRYDTKSILDKIKGQNKNILSSIMKENKNSITEIQATIRPQWKKTFPENIKKIKVLDLVRNIEVI
ncbi:MAG: hypothetical protein WC827_00090 [Candidatus Paceibacterota bacterium]|jgi:hypothetical protein